MSCRWPMQFCSQWSGEKRLGTRQKKRWQEKTKQNKKHNMELNYISARNEMDFFHIFRLLCLNRKYTERTQHNNDLILFSFTPSWRTKWRKPTSKLQNISTRWTWFPQRCQRDKNLLAGRPSNPSWYRLSENNQWKGQQSYPLLWKNVAHDKITLRCAFLFFLGGKKQTVKKDKKRGSSSSLLKEWRQAFRGQCRAPWRIPNKGQKYRMCPEWVSLLNLRACLHGVGGP